MCQESTLSQLISHHVLHDGMPESKQESTESPTAPMSIAQIAPWLSGVEIMSAALVVLHQLVDHFDGVVLLNQPRSHSAVILRFFGGIHSCNLLDCREFVLQLEPICLISKVKKLAHNTPEFVFGSLPCIQLCTGRAHVLLDSELQQLCFSKCVRMCCAVDTPIAWFGPCRSINSSINLNGRHLAIVPSCAPMCVASNCSASALLLCTACLHQEHC